MTVGKEAAEERNVFGVVSRNFLRIHALRITKKDLNISFSLILFPFFFSN